MSEQKQLYLTVIMADTFKTEVAIYHENSYLPYSYRTIHIKLTDEQIKLLTPEKVGERCGKDVFEEVSSVFLEKI